MSSALTAPRIALLIALASAATVLAALAFEHMGGYVPCALCLKERLPYYIGTPIALVAAYLLSKPQHRGMGLALIALTGLIFLTSFGLGTYHAGAEWGFWPGPDSCGGGGVTAGSAADLLGSLDSTRIVRCDEAGWRMFGLSFAGWNAVISLALAGLAFFGLRLCTKGR